MTTPEPWTITELLFPREGSAKAENMIKWAKRHSEEKERFYFPSEYKPSSTDGWTRLKKALKELCKANRFKVASSGIKGARKLKCNQHRNCKCRSTIGINEDKVRDLFYIAEHGGWSTHSGHGPLEPNKEESSSYDATSKENSSVSQIQEQKEKVRAFLNEQIALEQNPDIPFANRLQECYRVHRLNQVLKKGQFIDFLPEDSQFQSFSEIKDYLSEQQSSSQEAERTWTACEDYVWRLMSIDLTKGGMEEEQSSDENEIEL